MYFRTAMSAAFHGIGQGRKHELTNTQWNVPVLWCLTHSWLCWLVKLLESWQRLEEGKVFFFLKSFYNQPKPSAILIQQVKNLWIHEYCVYKDSLVIWHVHNWNNGNIKSRGYEEKKVIKKS